MTKTLRADIFKYGISFIAISGLILLVSAPFITPVKARAAEVIQTWWPTPGVSVSGVQPFKALVPGLDVSQYEMFWQVDGGSWNWMNSDYRDYPHKEASVDLSGWTWRGTGPYVVNFIARKNGVVIATYPVTIYVNGGTAPSPSAIVTTQRPVATDTTNPLAGFRFYVNPNSPAAAQAREWRYSNPTWSSMMQTLAAEPASAWFGNWNANLTQDVRNYVSGAQAASQVPVLVAYAIPQRDCGGYSSGGSNNPAAYASWIDALASGIGNGKAVIILEPDALAQITCLSSADQSTRLSLLGNAVTTLKKNPGTKVYIDAGHSNWIDPSVMANRLIKANISAADGFVVNVSNFMSTQDEISYGTSLGGKLNNKHFVVDTSRNGKGSDGSWCNPWGRAIGNRPTTATNNALVDAFLWIKVPGESDGPCNGGPSAGVWWPSYALGLVQNSSYITAL